ncbi:MAG: nickel pincer cofactor biosynthesis protein LarC [Acidobacteriota bacterium]
MRGLYLDCFAGISGDMVLGALVDLGVGIGELRAGLRRLPVRGYTVSARPATRSHLGGTRVEVVVSRRQPRRDIRDIRRILRSSRLSSEVRSRAQRAFDALVDAEARVHRIRRDRVHLHEVGAVDAIVDITGAMIGLERLGWPRVVCSPLNLGRGTVATSQGTFPVPAPATAELIRGRPCYANQMEGELVTPTGAALAATLAEEFGPLPSMRIRKVGYGAGARDHPGHPNLLRLLLGDLADRAAVHETVLVLETTIDDMNPQLYGHLMDRLFAAGALEVFYAPIQMKKNRPGTMVKVICPALRLEDVSAVIFRETTTIGFRYVPMGRIELDRRIDSVATPFGRVRVKVSFHNGEIVQATPEYEDCRALALKAGVPLKDVQRAAAAAAVSPRPRPGRPGPSGAGRRRRAPRGTGASRRARTPRTARRPARPRIGPR